MFTYLCTDSSNWIWFSGVASFYKWWLKLGTKVGRLQILNFCPLWICLIWYNTSCWCYTLCWVSKNMNTHTYIHAYICVCIYIYIYIVVSSLNLYYSKSKPPVVGKKIILELRHFHEWVPRTKISVNISDILPIYCVLGSVEMISGGDTSSRQYFGKNRANFFI